MTFSADIIDVSRLINVILRDKYVRTYYYNFSRIDLIEATLVISNYYSERHSNFILSMLLKYTQNLSLVP